MNPRGGTQRSREGRDPSEAGFALPMTILLLAVLTVLLSATFMRVTADRRVAVSSEASVTSLALAQSGLQTFMSSVATPPVDGDSVRINLNGGYADVVARAVQQPPDTTESKTYIIRSTGYVIAPSQGSVPLAQRTVAQFAVWQPAYMRPLGAMTAVGGSHGVYEDIANADAWFSGLDQCGVEANIPGIRSHTGAVGAVSSTNPDLSSRGLLLVGTGSDVATETGILWNAITNGYITPDYTTLVPPLVSGGLPDTTFSTYLIDVSELEEPNIRGSGLLIVTGELDTGDNSGHTYFEWDGVVLVGEDLDADAIDSTVVRGLLVVGLNTLLGSSPDRTYLDANPVYVYFNSCNIRRALERWRGFAPIPNAWVDNWAMY